MKCYENLQKKYGKSVVASVGSTIFCVTVFFLVYQGTYTRTDFVADIVIPNEFMHHTLEKIDVGNFKSNSVNCSSEPQIVVIMLTNDSEDEILKKQLSYLKMYTEELKNSGRAKIKLIFARGVSAKKESRRSEKSSNFKDQTLLLERDNINETSGSESTNIALSGLKWFVENCNARHSSVIVTETDVKLKYLELSKKFSEDSLKQNKDTYRSKFIACLENSDFSNITSIRVENDIPYQFCSRAGFIMTGARAKRLIAEAEHTRRDSTLPFNQYLSGVLREKSEEKVKLILPSSNCELGVSKTEDDLIPALETVQNCRQKN